MLKSLLESINREVVTESDEDLISDNMDTSIRDAYLDEDGDILPNDVTEAKIKDLIENLPETDSNGITKDEIRELSESYTDIFDEHDYVFEGAVEVPDKLTDLKKKVKALEKKEKLSIADKAKLAKYQAQIKVLSKVAKKKGIKEAASSLYADDEEIVDQYKGSARNDRSTPELYADKEEIIDQGTYEDTEIDLTEESFSFDDFETSMEGTTYDSIKIGMSKDKKEADKLFKSAKANCKAGKYDVAIKDMEKAKSIYKKLAKDLEKLDDSAISSICSALISGFPISTIYALCVGKGQSVMHLTDLVSNIVGGAVAAAGAGSMGASASSMGAGVRVATGMSITNSTVDTHNFTKGKTIMAMNKAVELCDKTIAEIKKAKKGVKESAGLYADHEEIIDQYKSSFNNTRTTKDLYADDEEIKDVGVYEEDELDLTDLDDGIESGCGSANEVSFRPSAKDDKMVKLRGEIINLEDKIAEAKRKGVSESEIKDYTNQLSDKKYELNTMLIDSHAGDRRAAMAGSDIDLSESSDMYADDQEINDQYKSSPNIQRTGNNNYADNQEIKDVGVYEDDDLDLTDLDDDIECGNNCGSTMEVKGEAEAEYSHERAANHFTGRHIKTNPDESKRIDTIRAAQNQRAMHTSNDYHERADIANTRRRFNDEADSEYHSNRVLRKTHEEVDLDLTAEEAFELDLLEANIYADDEPVEDKYKSSPSGKIEHDDYYADNQEIKDVGVYEADDNDETPEVDEGDPGELAAESFIDLTDI